MNKKAEFHIAKLITLIILLLISYFLFQWGQSLNKRFGIMSAPCQNLTWQGYYENSLEWVEHDSCIVGNFTWKNDCRFILPWWVTTRCMHHIDKTAFYNKTCNKILWETNESQMQYFNTHCVSSPWIKIIPLFPYILMWMCVVLAIGTFISFFYSEGVPDA